jgi:hypothetical protein
MNRSLRALTSAFTILFGLASLLCPATICLATPTNAQTIELFATDNATVQPAGPRSGASGKLFFDAEGSDNGSFASFGVADFDYSTVPPGDFPQAASIIDAQLNLTQDNAAFSAAGPISVYYTANTSVSIQPGTSSLKDQTGNDGAASVDPALSPLTLLGSGTFTNVSNGTVDTVPLSFSGDALTGFLNAFNNGTTLRLIVTANTPGTAATYVGVGNGTDPLLIVDYTPVPEPSTLILLALGAFGLLAHWHAESDCTADGIIAIARSHRNDTI